MVPSERFLVLGAAGASAANTLACSNKSPAFAIVSFSTLSCSAKAENSEVRPFRVLPSKLLSTMDRFELLKQPQIC
jgi:hypothetical protein